MSETDTKIRRFTLTSSEWTPILAPAPCNYYEIFNCDPNYAVQRSSDPTNPNAWHDIPAGAAYEMQAPAVRAICRFQAGDTVTYLKAYAGGTGVVCVEFML